MTTLTIHYLDHQDVKRTVTLSDTEDVRTIVSEFSDQPNGIGVPLEKGKVLMIPFRRILLMELVGEGVGDE